MKSIDDNKEILNALYQRRINLIDVRADIDKQLEATNNAIIGFGGTLPHVTKGVSLSSGEMRALTHTNIPKEYSEDLRWSQKLLFVLKKLHRATVSDIVSEIIREEPELDPEKVKRTITFYASHLFTTNKINATTGGKAYVYHLDE